MDAKFSNHNAQNNFRADLYPPIIGFSGPEHMSNPNLNSATSSDISVSPLIDVISTQGEVSHGISSSDDVASSPSGDSDSSSDPTLKYIVDMLLEEDIVDQPYMFDDHIGLKATENSFYDALFQQYPPSVTSDIGYLINDNSANNHSEDSKWLSSFYSSNKDVSADLASPECDDTSLSSLRTPSSNGFCKNENSYTDFLSSENSSNVLDDGANELPVSNASEMVRNMFSDSESVMFFNRGLEEASKFLPEPNQLVDLENYKPLASGVMHDQSLQREAVKGIGRNRKIHERDELDFQERNSKQFAVAVEEDDDDDSDLAEMFDHVLLLPNRCEKQRAKILAASEETANGSKGRKNRKRKNKKDSIDLRTQLILCAQAMSTSDFRTASELLKQISLHSSAHGDGSQRLAHYFANGLEARLAGSTGGIHTFYESLTVKKVTAADMLKAFQTLISSCPFKKLTLFYINKMIYKMSEHAKILHIVDYGILFGYQWPSLIQILSCRTNGPPKLRITAIDLPQRGFRPSERIKETGRRLSKYCQRFDVPFEYIPIVEKNWQNINIEDLKIREDEFVVANCLDRLHNFVDETGEGECPRDVFLSSIRKMNPDMFCYLELNGSFNSPFFVTRFREALFHYSAVFDYLDCTLAQDNMERRLIEEDIYGREAINVVACEGLERVIRPETYKQWQARSMRAGFKQLPLDQQLMDQCRTKGKMYYHKDFVIDEDGHWLLQGWKGRILFCSSCWVCA